MRTITGLSVLIEETDGAHMRYTFETYGAAKAARVLADIVRNCEANGARILDVELGDGSDLGDIDAPIPFALVEIN